MTYITAQEASQILQVDRSVAGYLIRRGHIQPSRSASGGRSARPTSVTMALRHWKTPTPTPPKETP